MAIELKDVPLSGSTLEKILDWVFNAKFSATPLAQAMKTTGGFLAGGAFKTLAQVDPEQMNDLFYFATLPKDYDLFFPSLAAQEQATELLTAAGYTVEYDTRNSVGLAQAGRTVDLVKRKIGTVEEVLESFDLTLSCCALYWNGAEWRTTWTPAYEEDLKEKRVRFTSEDTDTLHPFERIHRYHGYTYKVEDTTLAVAARKACATQGCPPRTAAVESKKFFQAVEQRQEQLHHRKEFRNQSSYHNSSGEVLEEMLHSIWHQLAADPKASGELPKLSEYLEDYPLAREQLHSGEQNYFYKEEALTPGWGKIISFCEAHELSPEELLAFKTLLFSQTVVREREPWGNSAIMGRLLEQALDPEERPHLQSYLEDLLLIDPPTYREWKEQLNSDIFTLSLSPSLVTLLYREDKVNNSASMAFEMRESVRQLLTEKIQPAIQPATVSPF